MAKKNEKIGEFDDPDFEKQHTGHEGWIDCDLMRGKPIQGTLESAKRKNGTDRLQFEYLIKLEKEALGKASEEDGGETITYSPGQIVALTETKQLAEVLRQFVNSVDKSGEPTKARIRVIPGDKKPLKSDRSKSFRDFEVYVNTRSVRPGEMAQVFRDSDGDDIPF